MDEKIQRVIDPNLIAILTVDDIDLLLADRDAPSSGGADKDLLKGLMDFFSGVGTQYAGGYFSIAATNKPTGTDDALRQRFIYRAVVLGPETWEDNADLVALQLKRPAKFDIVRISDKEYSPLKRPREKHLSSNNSAHNNGLSHGSTWKDIGNFVLELRHKGPWFTGRSIKNAMDTVIANASDFDVPEEWFDKPDAFANKPWDERIKMVRELFGTISADSAMIALQHQFDAEDRYIKEEATKAKDEEKRRLQVRIDATKELGV